MKLDSQLFFLLLFYDRDWQGGVIIKLMKNYHIFSIIRRFCPFPQVFRQVKECLIPQLHKMIRELHEVRFPIVFFVVVL